MNWFGIFDIILNFVVYYEFDEGSGFMVGDLIFNNLDGMLINLLSWMMGIIGLGVLDFDGSNEYVVVGEDDVFELGFGDFIVFFWFNSMIIFFS